MIFAFSQICEPNFVALFSREKIFDFEIFDKSAPRDLLLRIANFWQKNGFAPRKIGKKIILKNQKNGTEISQILFSAGKGNFTPARVSALLANLFSQNCAVKIYDFENDIFQNLQKKFPEKNAAEIAQKIFLENKFHETKIAKPRFSGELRLG